MKFSDTNQILLEGMHDIGVAGGYAGKEEVSLVRGRMEGAVYVVDEDFGGRGINVADRGGGLHIKFAGSGFYNGGVRYLVRGFG